MGDITVKALTAQRTRLKTKIRTLSAMLPFEDGLEYRHQKRRLERYEDELKTLDRKLQERIDASA